MPAQRPSASSPLPPPPPPTLTPLRTSLPIPSRNDPTSTSPAEPSPLSARVTSLPSRNEIEMEPIHSHRRRKSSLMAPVSQLAVPISPGRRPRAQSLRTPTRHTSAGGPSLGEEPKISEEDDNLANSSGLLSPMIGKDDAENDSHSDDDLQDDEETGLTAKEKKKRQKKRRRNTLLDQRIVPSKEQSPEEKTEADQAIVRRIFINVVLILVWYLLSLSISLYNKWMFDEKRLNFAFPLFTTSAHMIVQFALATLTLYFIPSLRPQTPHASDGGRSRHTTEPPKESIMTKMFYFTRIGPCGAATGLDIGLGNMSLKVISLTFYTMCKSSSLAFVLLFAFVFRLEAPAWRLVVIIITIITGVVLMVFGEVEFKLDGFALVISAAFFSGFRWGLTQILLLRHPATSNPFSTIFFLTPVMFLTLFALAVPVEGFMPLFAGLKVLADEFGYVLAPLCLMFPGCIAFLMTAAEFALLQRTSVVTLSIAGIFKEVLTISAASFVFNDQLTTVNLIGLLVTLAAIAAYNWLKISQMRNEAHGSGPEDNKDYSPISSPSNSDADDSSHEENAGLLERDSFDNSLPLIAADGDIHTNLLPPMGHKESS